MLFTPKDPAKDRRQRHRFALFALVVGALAFGLTAQAARIGFGLNLPEERFLQLHLVLFWLSHLAVLAPLMLIGSRTAMLSVLLLGSLATANTFVRQAAVQADPAPYMHYDDRIPAAVWRRSI